MAPTREAHRSIRAISRHIAHVSKDANPLKLAEMHGTLGRAIADLATAQRNEQQEAK